MFASPPLALKSHGNNVEQPRWILPTHWVCIIAKNLSLDNPGLFKGAVSKSAQPYLPLREILSLCSQTEICPLLRREKPPLSSRLFAMQASVYGQSGTKGVRAFTQQKCLHTKGPCRISSWQLGAALLTAQLGSLRNKRVFCCPHREQTFRVTQPLQDKSKNSESRQ